MPLFGRQVIVDIGLAGATGRQFKGLRVNFRVEMDKASTPNTAMIKLWNAAQDAVALLQADQARVRLLVGYDVPLQVFYGAPIKEGVTEEQQGPDRVLTIEADDGGHELRDTYVDISFATQTTVAQVWAVVTTQLAAQGIAVGTANLNSTAVFPTGLTYSGPVMGLLDRIALLTQDALKRSADWYIRDGVLQLSAFESITGEPAVVFSSVTGNLIGSPSRKDKGIELTGLISPSLRPGKPFQVVSRSVNGLYVCERLVFEGDSGYSDPFYVHPYGVPLAA